MQIFYASRDGHARLIAYRIADRIAASGLVVTPQDLACDHAQLDPHSFVVVVAAVRYGHHLPQATRLLASFRKLSTPPPLALISVNLTARKSDKKSADDNPYLRKVLRRYGLAPVIARAVAGRLDYPRYTRFDRFMIRLIMTLTGGPTNPTDVVEFTDWNEVDALAGQISQLAHRYGAERESALR